MSKYFDNANTQVTRNNFGSNFGRKITNKNLIPVKQRDKVDKQEVMMEARKKYMDINNQAQRKQIDKIKNQREFRKVINESYEKLKNDLFCNILHHICLEALTIDEEPMYESMEQITDSINEQFKSIGGLDVLKEQAKTSNNELIKRMITVCENTAKKVADRNLKECDSADEFKFELNDEEKDDFDYNKDSINIDAIANKIKDKIIKVVTDEKKANTKKTEIMDEIKDKLDEDEVEDEAATEAMEFIFNQKIETTTLFEALMRDCYKITLEAPEKTFYGSYVKENSEEDDTEYKFKDLDTFEDNNVMTDEEIVDDLMISESFSNQLPINDLEKLETMISESVKLRSTPGNLGFYSDYDTGVSDIIKSAKENEHIAEVILQPGFRENIMNLIKVAKHGPDVAYINQLAKLPFRIFGRKGRAVKVLENYETWLNNEYKDLYLETLNNLGISLKTIPEFRQQLLSYKPVSDVFIENAEGILEAVADSDYNEMDSKLKNTSDKLKKVAEDCGKNKKDLSSCKESIREIQKSTEELKDNSKNSKSCAEVCSAKSISKDKDDLAEMLVCPECGKDPCECEDSLVIEIDDIDNDVEDDLAETLCPKCGKNPCKCEDSSVIESDDIDSDNDAEDEDYKKYLDDDDDIDFIEEGLKDKVINFKQKEIQNIKKSTLKKINKIKSKKDMLNVVDRIEIDIETLKTSSNVYNRKNKDGKYDNILEDIDEMIDWLENDAKDLTASQYKKVSESLCLEEGKQYRCMSCGYIAEDEAPEYCPKCGNDADQFKLLQESVIDRIVDKFANSLDKHGARKDIGKYNKMKEDMIKAINKTKKDEQLDNMNSVIQAACSSIQERIDFMKNDDSFTKENIKEVEGYLRWLKSDVPRLVKKRKSELVKESFDYTEEVSKDGKRFTIRNTGNLMLNVLQRNHNLGDVRKRLTKMASKCKTVGEVEYLQKDLPNGKKFIQNKINSTTDPEKKKEYETHLKWMSTEYSKTLSNRKKQLKTAVKEQADFEQDFLYGKDRALYSIKESKNNILDIPKPSNMRKYCLLKKINEATSFNDLKEVKEYIMEEMSVYKANKEYVSWLRNTLDNTVELKHNVLEEQVLIDRFVNQLDEICESIDSELDKHDEAKQIALESMYTNFHGDRVFAPIFKTNDVNSNNMEFAYKLKFVCEGLKGLTKDCQNDVELAQAERLISRNINTIESLMESLEDNGCYQYKLNTLNTAKKYLEKLSSHIPALKDKYVMESLDYEYDEELITEAVELTDEVYENAMSEDVLYNTKNELMDVVMAEAITKYTIMETFNTLKLTNLNHDDIEKIVRDIIK